MNTDYNQNMNNYFCLTKDSNYRLRKFTILTILTINIKMNNIIKVMDIRNNTIFEKIGYKMKIITKYYAKELIYILSRV